MKLGIRAHDLGMKDSAQEMASAIREAGFQTAQLVLSKAIKGALHKAGDITKPYASAIKDAFKQEEVEISLLGAYFNWFNKSTDGLEKYKEHLQYAADFGTTIVGSEVQGISSDRWGLNPENHTEEAMNHVIAIAKDLVTTAQKFNVKAGIEGAIAHTLSTPKEVSDLALTLNTDHLSLIFDLYNFLGLDNYDKQRSIIDEVLELYGNRLDIVHCKDFIPQQDQLEQVALGKGLFDYNYLIKRLYQTGHENVTLIFEGVTGEEIGTSLTYIKNVIDSCC